MPLAPVSARPRSAQIVGAGDTAAARRRESASAEREPFRSYLPELVVSRLAAPGSRPGAPEAERFAGAVLFADISGFTPLAERLARRGAGGVEELSLLLNAYFGELTRLVAEHGGDVIAFAGDALIAAWPARQEDVATNARRAARCAMVVRAALHGYDAGGVVLSLRIGVGAGEMTALHVGGHDGRWRFLLSGAPLLQMSQAEQRAEPGDIVVSPRAWALIRPHASIRRRVGGYAYLEAVDDSVPPRAIARSAGALGDTAEDYLVDALRNRLAAGRTEWLGELRRVTPLFVSLLGVDPSDPELLRPVQTLMGEVQPVLARYEGTLKEVVVDDKGLTLVAVFGLPPLAHEDDPVRAVRTALAVQAALRESGLRSAMGLATGRAYCGPVGSDVRREYAVVGDVMNLAARQTQAAKETILCDEATFRAARSALAFEAGPALRLKGKSAPAAVYRPLGPARTTGARTGIVGRREERARLVERLDALEAGRSSTLLIEGEPGMGKSRLVADLVDAARARGVRVLLGAGDAIEKSTPYHAWCAVLGDALGLHGDEEVEERRSRVLGRLRAIPELSGMAPLLNAVMVLDLPDNELTAQLSGEVRAENTRELLLRLLAPAAVDGRAPPSLVVVDDAHWLDSSSWALVRLVAQRLTPVMLVLAHRPLPDAAPADYSDLRAQPAVTCWALDPLTSRDIAALVQSRLQVASVPDPVAHMIDARAQGNPFFAEELAHALRDAGLIRIGDGVCTIAPGTPLASIGVPDTVEGVVAGRIDRLPAGHALALKVASVVGRAFSLGIVHDVHPLDAERPALPGHLDELRRRDFILLDTPASEPAYIFKHVVTQEVAYNLLLHAQRRRLHRAVAEWYERRESQDQSSLHPLLAHHWGRAGEPRRELASLELAAGAALRGGAFQEAVEFLTQALGVGGDLSPAPDARRIAGWHRRLGEAYFGLGRLPESRLHTERAIVLLGRSLPRESLPVAGDLAAQVLRQAARRAIRRREPRASLAEREALLEATRAYERLAMLNYYANARATGISAVLHAANLAESAGPSPELARAFATMGIAAGVVGLHRLARAYGRWAVAIARDAGDLPALAFVLLATSAYDVSVGRWRTARHAVTEGLTLAERLGDQRRRGELAAVLAQVLYHEGAFERLSDWAAEMSAIAADADDPQRQAHARLAQAWHLLPQGRHDVAVARLEEATDLLAGHGSRADEIFAAGLLTLACLRAGDQLRARAAADRAAALIAESRPTAVHILEGYAGVAEVYLSLWENGDRSAAPPAAVSCAALRRYARAFPIARPRAWLLRGLEAHAAGRPRRAHAAWQRAMATAARLGMPYEAARAGYEIGRHLPAGSAARERHLARAAETFAGIGATFELSRCRAAQAP